MPSSACPATCEISTLSLHDALPIFVGVGHGQFVPQLGVAGRVLSGFLHIQGGEGSFRAVTGAVGRGVAPVEVEAAQVGVVVGVARVDRKSTRLNSSHQIISYAVFCLSGDLRDLHSFPTRRSSDLCGRRPRPVRPTIGRCRASSQWLSPYSRRRGELSSGHRRRWEGCRSSRGRGGPGWRSGRCCAGRSEEHTSELQSPDHLVCRLLLVRRPARSPLFPYTTLFRSLWA